VQAGLELMILLPQPRVLGLQVCTTLGGCSIFKSPPNQDPVQDHTLYLDVMSQVPFELEKFLCALHCLHDGDTCAETGHVLCVN
jgi:hypothetical protein